MNDQGDQPAWCGSVLRPTSVVRDVAGAEVGFAGLSASGMSGESFSIILSPE